MLIEGTFYELRHYEVLISWSGKYLKTSHLAEQRYAIEQMHTPLYPLILAAFDDDVGDQHPHGYASYFFTRRALALLEG